MSAKSIHDLKSDYLGPCQSWPKQRAPSMSIELHGIRFSRGTPHPYVVGAIIPTEGSDDTYVDMAIAGDRTILSITKPASRRIFLHSWKDGLVHLVRTPGYRNHRPVP